jgi:hypothetical protein
MIVTALIFIKGRDMAGRVPYKQYPWWVKFSLWGVPGRASVLAFAWLCVLLAVGSSAYFLWIGHRRWYVGLLFFLGALAYWRSVSWVDSHGSWERSSE